MDKKQLSAIAARALATGRVVQWMQTAPEREQQSFADGLWLAAIFNGIKPHDLAPDDLVDLFDQAHLLRPRDN